jgi:hypothetical protein
MAWSRSSDSPYQRGMPVISRRTVAFVRHGRLRSSGSSQSSSCATSRPPDPRFSGKTASTTSTPVAEGARSPCKPRACAATPIVRQIVKSSSTRSARSITTWSRTKLSQRSISDRSSTSNRTRRRGSKPARPTTWRSPRRRSSAAAQGRLRHRYKTGKLFGGLNLPPAIRAPSPLRASYRGATCRQAFPEYPDAGAS